MGRAADDKPPTGSAGDRLLRAAEQGDVAATQAALDEGANPLAHVLGTMTALHVAARDGKTKVVRLLLEKAPCDSSLLRDVHFVASGSVRGRAEVVTLIEEALEDACRREQGLPPVTRPAPVPFAPSTPLEALLFAIHEDDVAGARRALEEGADVNALTDAGGFTPLMAAARSGNLALVELLLDAGGDPLRTYVGGNTAGDLAAQARYHEAAAVLSRAAVAETLKARRAYLRNFAHEIVGRTGEERIIFHAGTRFFSAFWATAEKRVREVRWWTEAEFRQLLSHGTYGAGAGHLFGDFSTVPEEVRTTAPERARRCDEVLAALADGSRQLALTRSWRDPGSPSWFLRRYESHWLMAMGRDLMPITAERAVAEVEETLRDTPEVELVPVDAGQTKKMLAAIKAARAALRRLHAGEVWIDEGTLRWGQDGRLYFGVRKGRGRVQTASEQTEQAFFDELVGRYARGGRPRIARDPKVHAQAAPLVEEGGFLTLLEAGQIALGGYHSLIYRRQDGSFVHDGTSGTQELTRPQLLEILKSRRYGWVERRGRSR